MTQQRRVGVHDLGLEILNGKSGNSGISLSSYAPRHITRLNPQDVLVALDEYEEPIRLLHEYLKERFGVILGELNEFLFIPQIEDQTLAKSLSLNSEALRDIKRKFAGATLDPFIQHQTIDEIAKKTGLSTVASFEMAERFNCKVEFITLMRQIGIELPETEILNGNLWDFLEDRANFERFKKGVLKKKRGASGQGMKLGTPYDMLEFFDIWEESDVKDGYVLQKMIDVSTSPSVIYETHVDGTFSNTTLSMQLLESDSPETPPSVHLGNVYIPFLDMTAMDGMIKKIIQLCAGTEAYGPAGCDFMITKNYETFPAEINYRLTGTFQYMELASKLKKAGLLKDNQVWAGMNIARGNTTSEKVLELCDRDEFRGKVVPTNLANSTKVMTLFTGDEYSEIMSLATNFEGELSGADSSDRNEGYIENVEGLVSDIKQGLLR